MHTTPQTRWKVHPSCLNVGIIDTQSEAYWHCIWVGKWGGMGVYHVSEHCESSLGCHTVYIIPLMCMHNAQHAANTLASASFMLEYRIYGPNLGQLMYLFLHVFDTLTPVLLHPVHLEAVGKYNNV